MATEYWTKRVVRRRTLLDELIRGRGIERYGLFAVTTEGKPLPDGSETASGFVIDEDGGVHAFWIGWDGDQRRPEFTSWKAVQSEPDWEEDAEYREARKAAGLS